ncbi:MAG: stage II sporulation protein P [Clostridia bacterium]|nr:stage II sporulation protein P [Clostridia bacterium]
MKKHFRFSYDTAAIITAVAVIAGMMGLSSPSAAHTAFALAEKAVKSAEKVSATPFSAILGDISAADTSEAERTVFAENPLSQLTETPDDILQLIKSAEDNAKNDIEDGKIEERKYGAISTSTLIGNIAVRNNTDTQQNINLLKYYEADPEIKITDKAQPTVLIFHTHTTECYELLDRSWYAQDYITRSNSSDRNMVRVGMEIKEQLEKAGYSVIHDTEIHDTKYTGAYAHSRKSVEKYLEQYPSIQVVLDIHRDAIEQSGGVRIKPTAEILGKKAAQLMIITGCEEGKVTDFPDWEQNLTFALRLQSICEEKFPGLMRPVYFCQRKYNMDLSPNNLLVEVGSCANTLEEAAYAGRLLGSSLATLLDRSIDEKTA